MKYFGPIPDTSTAYASFVCPACKCSLATVDGIDVACPECGNSLNGVESKPVEASKIIAAVSNAPFSSLVCMCDCGSESVTTATSFKDVSNLYCTQCGSHMPEAFKALSTLTTYATNAEGNSSSSTQKEKNMKNSKVDVESLIEAAFAEAEAGESKSPKKVTAKTSPVKKAVAEVDDEEDESEEESEDQEKEDEAEDKPEFGEDGFESLSDVGDDMVDPEVEDVEDAEDEDDAIAKIVKAAKRLSKIGASYTISPKTGAITILAMDDVNDVNDGDSILDEEEPMLPEDGEDLEEETNSDEENPSVEDAEEMADESEEESIGDGIDFAADEGNEEASEDELADDASEDGDAVVVEECMNVDAMVNAAFAKVAKASKSTKTVVKAKTKTRADYEPEAPAPDADSGGPVAEVAPNSNTPSDREPGEAFADGEPGEDGTAPIGEEMADKIINDEDINDDASKDEGMDAVSDMPSVESPAPNSNTPSNREPGEAFAHFALANLDSKGMQTVLAEEIEMKLYDRDEENPYYNVTIKAAPIGRIYWKDQDQSSTKRGKKFFVDADYQRTLTRTMARLGPKKILSEVNARLFSNAVKNTTLAKEMLQTAYKKVAKANTEKLIGLRDNLLQCQSMAVSGINKNLFRELGNPLKAAIWNGLIENGFRGDEATAFVDKVLKDGTTKYFEAVSKKAVELMDMPKEAREALASVIGNSGEVTASTEEGYGYSESFEQRMVNGNFPVTNPASFAEEIEASAEPTDYKKSLKSRISLRASK